MMKDIVVFASESIKLLAINLLPHSFSVNCCQQISVISFPEVQGHLIFIINLNARIILFNRARLKQPRLSTHRSQQIFAVGVRAAYQKDPPASHSNFRIHLHYIHNTDGRFKLH